MYLYGLFLYPRVSLHVRPVMYKSEILFKTTYLTSTVATEYTLVAADTKLLLGD